MKKILSVLLLLTVFSIAGYSAGVGSKHRVADTATLGYFFADSTHIGRKGHNKVTLSEYSLPDSGYVVVKFYARSTKGKWHLKQKFEFSKMDAIDCDPKMSDFNHDGLGDLTYISMFAVRGANEVRRLFIYDKDRDRLVYGGCSTVFLRIRGNRLVEFACVDVTEEEGLSVYTIDQRGRRKQIRHQANIHGVGFARFKNYRPLVEYVLP